eukprot:m.60965 g.60965  ORF g.60965 m.60965 type:complete len:1082 (+) comp11369_c0_seq2:121-3366(+)
MTSYDWELNRDRWSKIINATLKKEIKLYPDFTLDADALSLLETHAYNIFAHLCSQEDGVPNTKLGAEEAIRAVFPPDITAWVLVEVATAWDNVLKKNKQTIHVKTFADTLLGQLNKFVCPENHSNEEAITLLSAAILCVFKDIIKASVKYCTKMTVREISADIVDIIIKAGVFSAMFDQCEKVPGSQLKVKLTYMQLVTGLLQSEKDFSTQLDTILKVFLDTLENDYGVDEQTSRRIFQNIADIKQISDSLAIDFEDALEKSSIHKAYPIISHIFDSFTATKDYEPFQRYAYGLRDALQALNDKLDNQEFGQAVEASNQNFAMALRFELPHLLLSPVHHFKHLALALELLLEKARNSEDRFVHSGCNSIGEALSLVNPAAEAMVLDGLPVRHTYTTELELAPFVKAATLRSQKRLLSSIDGISDGDAFLLRSPCLHQGEICISGKWRYGFLLQTQLIICKKNSNMKKMKFQRDRYIPLSAMHVYHVPKPGMTQIEFKVEDKKETLCTKNEEALHEWIAAICRVAGSNFVRQSLKQRLADIDITLADLLPPPENYEFATPDGPTNIRYSAESSSIQAKTSSAQGLKGGTLIKLVEQLSSPNYLDLLYVTQFLLTYRKFCSPEELFDLFIARQNIPIDHLEQKPVEKRRFQKLYCIPVIVQVLNVLKIWVDKHYYDFEGGLTKKLLLFVKGLLQKDRRHERQCNAIVRCIKAHLRPKSSEVFIEYSSPPPATMWLPGEIIHTHILEFHPVELARQLTLIDSKLYRAINASELVDAAWTRDDRDAKAPNVMAFMHHFNHISNWVRRSVMEMENLEERTLVLLYFLEMFCRLRKLNNFSSLMALHAGLQSSGVIRLKKSWDGLPARYANVIEDFEAELGGQNYPGLRALHECAEPPCVPFLGIYQTDIVKAEDDTIPNFLPSVEGDEETRKNSLIINFAKRRQVARACIAIERFQNRTYNLAVDEDVQNFIVGAPSVMNPPFSVPAESTSSALNAFEDALYQQSLRLEPRSGEPLEGTRLFEDIKLLHDRRDTVVKAKLRKSTKTFSRNSTDLVKRASLAQRPSFAKKRSISQSSTTADESTSSA